jgi:hypothetical protein
MAKKRYGLGKQMVQAAYEQMPDESLDMCDKYKLWRHIDNAYQAALAIYEGSTLKIKNASPWAAVASALWYHSIGDVDMDISEVDAGCRGAEPYLVFARVMLSKEARDWK